MESSLIKSIPYSQISLVSLIDKIIPKITKLSHKGDNGSIGVIGGSEEYTGAPYYSAITSLKAGSDLSHIFCHTAASIPIKSYSPELIVHPSFNESCDRNLIEKSKKKINYMNSIAFGCGLGREKEIANIFAEFTNSIAKNNKIPLVFDADSLWYLSKNYDLLDENFHNYKYLIMTPNFKEYGRLLKDLLNIEVDDNNNSIEFPEGDILLYENESFEKIKSFFQNELKLCQKLNKKILVKKGKYDLITNGFKIIVVKNEGSLKRTGGIGDILAGFINSYCGMVRRQYEIKNKVLDQDILMDCCALGCYYCRKTSMIAYNKYKFSLTAPDIINEIRESVNNYQV